MADFYEDLITEPQTDWLVRGYATMTDEEVSASLNERNRRIPTQRFISMRAIAAVLDDVEYAKVKAAIQTLAGQSQRVADMLAFLNMPCDESGTTGGIDFGNDSVRQMIETLRQIDGSIQEATMPSCLRWASASSAGLMSLGLAR